MPYGLTLQYIDYDIMNSQTGLYFSKGAKSYIRINDGDYKQGDIYSLGEILCEMVKPFDSDEVKVKVCENVNMTELICFYIQIAFT